MACDLLLNLNRCIDPDATTVTCDTSLEEFESLAGGATYLQSAIPACCEPYLLRPHIAQFPRAVAALARTDSDSSLLSAAESGSSACALAKCASASAEPLRTR